MLQVGHSHSIGETASKEAMVLCGLTVFVGAGGAEIRATSYGEREAGRSTLALDRCVAPAADGWGSLVRTLIGRRLADRLEVHVILECVIVVRLTMG